MKFIGQHLVRGIQTAAVCNSSESFTAETQEIVHLKDAAGRQESRLYRPVL